MRKHLFAFLCSAFLILPGIFSLNHLNAQNGGSFYKHLRGFINKSLPVTMDLHFDGKNFSGFYVYDKYKIPLSITGYHETNGDVILYEGNKTKNTGIFKGKFISEDIYSGTWYGPDGGTNFPFSLVEDYSDGSLQLEAFNISDTTYMLDKPRGNINPSITQHFFGLDIVKGQGSIAEKTSITLRIQAIGEYGETDRSPEVVKNRMNVLSEDYLSLGVDDGYEPDEFIDQWNEDVGMFVSFNKNKFLSIRLDYNSFTGGAHDSYGCNFFNIDLTTGNTLNMFDVLEMIPEESFNNLLTQKCRKYFELEADEPLTVVLYDDEIPLPTMFYVQENGVGFFYNVYEIGPYVSGNIDLFFTWEEVSPYLVGISPIKRLFK